MTCHVCGSPTCLGECIPEVKGDWETMSICMCSTLYCCEQKNSCYRFRKEPHPYRQPWANMHQFHPTDPSIKCINFIAIEGRKDIRK
jgi:hypothetical protein